MTALLPILTLLAAAWPTFEADTLAGGRIKMPDDAKGHVALIIMSFSQEAGGLGRPWAERYARESGRVYIAPVLEAAPRLVRGMIRGGMRKDIPENLHSRTMLIYTGEKEWKARADMQTGTEKQPYLMLLDREGNVIWKDHGAFDEQKYAALRKAADGR